MLVHAQSRSLLLRSRTPEKILQLIPKSRQVDAYGHNLQVRFGLDEAKLLKNLGLNVPSPVEYFYNWPGRYTPMAHQKETAAFLTFHRRAFVLSEMGTGKTGSVLWAADYLMREKQIRKVLIVSPLSTLEDVWQSEIYTFIMHRTSSVLHGSKKRRIERLARDTDFYIINYEGIQTIFDELRARKDIDLIIVDEASHYRNASTTRYKHLKALLNPDQRLWMLTGTPCPSAPTDAWALAKLVSPSRVPDHFGQFRRKTMVQVSTYKWAPIAGATEKAFDALQPAIRFRKEDCIDLPPVTFSDRHVEMSAQQKEAYATMKKTMLTELQASGGVQSITAVNAADQITKLRQILCGAIKMPGEAHYETLDFAPRLEVLKDTIREAGAKVIVVVPFKGIVWALEKALRDEWSTAVINGDISIKERNETLAQFKTSADPHVLLCHPKVMSHGLTLTQADMLIFYAPIYSNDQYQQVKDRINRPGQTRPMTIVRIACNWLERSIYANLDQQGTTQQHILDMYKNVLEEDA